MEIQDRAHLRHGWQVQLGSATLERGCVCGAFGKNNHIRSWSGSELTGGDLAGGLLTGTRSLPTSALGLGLGLGLLLGGGKPPLLLSPPLLPAPLLPAPLLPAPEPQYW
jgi:hypothetical protein